MNHNGILVRIQKPGRAGDTQAEVRVSVEPIIPALKDSLVSLFKNQYFHGHTQHELRFSVRGKLRCSTDSRGVLRRFLPEIERLVWAEMDKLAPRRATCGVDTFTSRDVARVNEFNFRKAQWATRNKNNGFWGFIRDILGLNFSSSGGDHVR